jgi:hypothetical protein
LGAGISQGGAAVDIGLRKGEVYVCQNPACRVEVEVRRGGRSAGLFCCGQKMAPAVTEAEALDRYAEEVQGSCNEEGA